MLLLVRHGQTQLNREGRLLGRLDVPLTDLGRRQAAATASAVLASASISRVVCSPLGRARETASAFEVPVEVDERWIELDYGEYDGLAFRDVPDELWQRWRADPTWAPPAGESLTDVGARVRSACEELASTAVDTDVVVVSHVSPIKAALAWALEVDDGVAWRMHLDVASVCRVGVGARGPSLRSFNETAHLARVV